MNFLAQYIYFTFFHFRRSGGVSGANQEKNAYTVYMYVNNPTTNTYPLKNRIL